MGDLPAGPTPWVLAATENSAARAAALGIPLACSGFHNPIKSADVLSNYHSNFQPSRFAAGISAPQSLLALRVFAGETQEDGERLAMPMRQAFALRREHNIRLAKMSTTEEAIAQTGGLVPAETELWSKLVVGSYDGVMEKIEQMVEQTGVEEIMVQVFSPDMAARKECHMEIASRLRRL